MKNDFSRSKLAWSIYQSLFWLENDHDNCPQANSGRKFDFFKIVLNRVLTLPNARSRKMRQITLKNMGLQNKNISVVTKHWKYKSLSPMTDISLFGLLRLRFGHPIIRPNPNLKFEIIPKIPKIHQPLSLIGWWNILIMFFFCNNSKKSQKLVSFYSLKISQKLVKNHSPKKLKTLVNH